MIIEDRWQNDNSSCVVVAKSNGIIIGQDLHMDGLDAPASLAWEDLERLIDWLGFIRSEHVAKRYKVE